MTPRREKGQMEGTRHVSEDTILEVPAQLSLQDPSCGHHLTANA